MDVTVWEPIVELPDDGTYEVVLTLSGPAGSESVEGEIDTSQGNVRGYTVGSGCSGVGPVAPLGGAALLAVLGGLVGRRRRR